MQRQRDSGLPMCLCASELKAFQEYKISNTKFLKVHQQFRSGTPAVCGAFTAANNEPVRHSGQMSPKIKSWPFIGHFRNPKSARLSYGKVVSLRMPWSKKPKEANNTRGAVICSRSKRLLCPEFKLSLSLSRLDSVKLQVSNWSIC